MSADAIGFNNIPGSGLTAPIFTFEVNSGGQYQQTTRLILQGFKTSSGTIATNAAPLPVASQNAVDLLAGPGSMLREMFRIAARNAPAQPIYIQAIPDPGTSARVVTVTVAQLPTPGQGVLKIMNRSIAVPVLASDTTATVAANLVAAINAFYDTLTDEMLPFTAAQGSTGHTGDVILTARHAGAVMNDALVWVPSSSYESSNVFSPSGVLTIVETTTGTGVPDISSALAALHDDPADFVVSPFSDTSNMAAAIACFSDVAGRWAWNRQVYGHYYGVYTGTFSGTVTFGQTLNDRHETVLRRWQNSLSPSWEWAAGMVARVAPWLSDITLGNVSRNQTGLRVEGVFGPTDRTALDNYSARNTLNNNAISTATMDWDGTVKIDKIVTTYRFGTAGQPDTVFRDIQTIYQACLGISYIRAVLAVEHGQKALANENPGNLAAISTPSDIKGTFIHAYDDLVYRGVYQDTDAFSRLIKVKINADNPDRCDVYAPIETVNPLDILASNATFYKAYPRSLLGSTPTQ